MSVDSAPRSPLVPPTDVAHRLIAAAGPVFGRQGFEGATVREISQLAGANVSSVNYHFGDKMGLYRAVLASIRSAREQQFPLPETKGLSAEVALRQLIETLLRRMYACDESGWESQLMMREMQNPTAVLEEMIQQYFRPLYDALSRTLSRLLCDSSPGADSPRRENDLNASGNRITRVTELAVGDDGFVDEALVAHLSMGVVGQCLHYRIGRHVIQSLIDPNTRQKHFDLDSISRHIFTVTLATCRQGNVVAQRRSYPRATKSDS